MPWRKPRRKASFSSEGGACTRYIAGWCSRSSSSAAATLASTMNSSISRWLSSRGRGVTLSTLARAVDHHLPLRQIEIERAARGPGGQQGAECGIEMRQRQAEIVARVMRPLHLLVGKARRAAHEAAAETVGLLAAAGVDAQLDEQAAAVLVGAQAAPAVGQRLRQHRHDAVGEIHAVAARARRMVERRTGVHIMRDVSDGDDQAEALIRPVRRTPHRRNRARPRHRW